MPPGLPLEPRSPAEVGTATAPAETPTSRRGFVGPFSRRQVALVALTAVVVAGILFLATRPLGSPADLSLPNPQPTPYLVGPATEGLAIGASAPELVGTRPDGTPFQLTDLDGRSLRLADLRGHLVWLNFWATWCPPCQAETPVLRATYEAYRQRGLVLIGIAVQESSVDDVRAYAQAYGLTYPIGWDVEAVVFHRYRVYALPTQFFIDGNGILRAIVQGPLDASRARGLVESLLPASPAP
jgi:thiol-disulfide isomerase/thioredoxin